MRENLTQQPSVDGLPVMTPKTFEAMFDLFTQIGIFWGNLKDPEAYRSRLKVFMQNRIKLNPIYVEYYRIAEYEINQLIKAHGEQQAYEHLFTLDTETASIPLSITREQVSNEFIAFQLSVGGFKAFGAKNFPGYIGGAYIPGQPAPYRT